MRFSICRGVCVGLLLALIGCRGDSGYQAPEEPMPPNTVLLSGMMRELSATPGFTDAMLAELDKDGKKGPALLTPSLLKRLRELILGRDWQGLDRFPGWTMREINPTVRVIGGVVAKDKDVDGLAARHPGAAAILPGSANSSKPAASAGAAKAGGLEAFIDLGSYSPEKSETVDLDVPSRLPGFSVSENVSELGRDVVRGDGANSALAPMHPESQRLADVLNRLSMNGLAEEYAPMKVTLAGRAAGTPEELVQALIESGHTVVVADARYFANFGHFHYKGQDVMMPFWVNSQIAVPRTGRGFFGRDRPLLLPVSHAEYEWRVRGPKVNADVSWYFGIDGKAEFRTMDTLDQAWVLGRHAHEYTGDDAVEVTRLMGKMTVAYMHEHRARPALPFGGYYALGVCQDAVAAIEKKMTGSTTLFPNTADTALFDDPRDAEVNALLAAIPKDRDGTPPPPERIFGSLPTVDLKAITIPGLAADLEAVQTAWREGELERTPTWIRKMTGRAVGVAALGLLLGIVVWRRRRR